MENLGGVIVVVGFLLFAGFSIWANWKQRKGSGSDDTGSNKPD